MSASRTSTGLAVLAAIILVAVGLGLFKILAGESNGTGMRGFPPVPVGVATTQETNFVDRINALGTARANESVTITAKVTETVREVLFDDGDVVETGTILVELTNDEDSAELQSARATLEEARKNFSRTQDLATTGSTTQARLEQARAQRDAAQGRVNAVEARLKDRLIRAPFSGILGLRQVSRGTLVRPGEVITTLDDVAHIKLDFTVPEKYLSALKAGQEIEATSPAFPGETFNGEVIAIETRIDPITRAVTARALIDNADYRLRPGLLMTVEVIREQKMALSVPQRAIVSVGEEIFVYRVKDRTVERVHVELGQRQDLDIEIVSGLEAGDQVIVDGVHRVRPGGPIQIVELDGQSVEPPQAAPQT